MHSFSSCLLANLLKMVVNSVTKIPKLFQLMDERKINAKTLSDATGISTGNISDWKNGRSKPSTEKLSILAAYFDVTTDYLLGNEQKKEPFAKAKGYSKEAIDLLARIDRLSPANRAKLSELIDLYLSAQDKK